MIAERVRATYYIIISSIKMCLDKNERKKRINHSQLRAYTITALIIIGVVALGLFAVNQFLEFRFKALLLSDPCQVCKDLNPDLDFLFREKSPYEIDLEKFKFP